MASASQTLPALDSEKLVITTAPLQVWMLGTFTLERDGQPIPLPHSSKACALLAYLLLHRPMPVSRPVLAGLFWPEVPEDRALRALSHALWHVKRSLPGLIQTRDNALYIPSEAALWTDTETFNALSAPHLRGEAAGPAALADMRRAASLYGGELLRGMYDDWVLEEQERLQEKYYRVLKALIHLEKSAGHYEPALEWTLRLLRADPFQEGVLREAMRLYVTLKRPQAALQLFENSQRLLAAEMNIAPEPETTALAQAIATIVQRSNAIAPRPDPDTEARPALFPGITPQALPLIGREAERMRLLDALEGMLRPTPSNQESPSHPIILIEGEAGVGKTRLIQELEHDAEWRGAQILRGHCVEAEIRQPYTPLIEALTGSLSPLRARQLTRLVLPVWMEVMSGLMPELAASLPELEVPPHMDPAEEHKRLAEAWIEILKGWAKINPLLILLEDLHHADQETLALLPQLARELAHQRILLVLTYRGAEARIQTPVWEHLQRLDRQTWCERLVLERLDETSTAALIRFILKLPYPVPRFEGRLYRETGGNPLFVIQLLITLYEEGLLFRNQQGHWATPFDETTEDYGELPLPKAVEQTILQRLSRLEPLARRVLDTAAILGMEVDLDLLQSAGDLPFAELMTAIQTLQNWEFLEETGQGYQFHHNVVRQVVYRAIPPAERTDLHARVARILVQNGSDQIAMLAHHATVGACWDMAVQYNFKAGQAAQAVYAHQAALDYYNRALQILETHTPFDALTAARLQFDLLSARQRLFWVQGEPQLQEQDLHAMQRLVGRLDDPARQIETLNQWADYLFNIRGDYPLARQQAEIALALAQSHGWTRLMVQAWQMIGSIAHRCDQHQEADRAFTRALTLHRTIEGPENLTQTALLYYKLANSALQLGELDEAEAHTRALLQCAETTRDTQSLGIAYYLLARLARVRGDFSTSLRYHQISLTCMQATGIRSHEARQQLNLGNAYSLLQDYGKAIEALHRSLDLCRQAGESFGEICALNNLSSLYARIGQWELARRLVETGLDQANLQTIPGWRVLLWCTLAEIHRNQGDLAAARQALHAAWPLIQGLTAPDILARTHFELGLIFGTENDWAAALPQLEQACTLAQQADEPPCLLTYEAWLARALLEVGRNEAAFQRSHHSLTELEALPGGNGIPEIYLHHGKILQALDQLIPACHVLEKGIAFLQAQKNTLPRPEWQRDFLEKVPLHRELLGIHRQLRDELSGRQRIVRLPRTDAPARGPIPESGWVQVKWTIPPSSNASVPDKAERRREQLLRLLREAGEQEAIPTVQDLAAALEVSSRTIDRDLALLRSRGHDLVTRGHCETDGPPEKMS